MLSRLLILSLFLPACIATAAAQPSPDKASLSSPLPSFTMPSSLLPQSGLAIPDDFHVFVPPLFQNIPGQLQPPLRQERFNGSRPAPVTIVVI